MVTCVCVCVCVCMCVCMKDVVSFILFFFKSKIVFYWKIPYIHFQKGFSNIQRT